MGLTNTPAPNADRVIIRASEEERTQTTHVEHVSHRVGVTLQQQYFLSRVQAKHVNRMIAAHRQRKLLVAVNTHTPVVIGVTQHRSAVQRLDVLISFILVNDGISLVRKRDHIFVVME